MKNIYHIQRMIKEGCYNPNVNLPYTTESFNRAISYWMEKNKPNGTNFLVNPVKDINNFTTIDLITIDPNDILGTVLEIGPTEVIIETSLEIKDPLYYRIEIYTKCDKIKAEDVEINVQRILKVVLRDITRGEDN